MFKAMGRAINKTVTIVELIKVLLVYASLSFFLSPFSILYLTVYGCGFVICAAEENCWSSPNHFNYLDRYK